MTNRVSVVPAFEPTDENVAELDTGYMPEEEEVADNGVGETRNKWILIGLLIVIALVGALLWQQNSTSQVEATAREPTSDIQEPLFTLEQKSALDQEIANTQMQIADLEVELAMLKEELSLAVDPAVVAALQQSEAGLLQELSDVRVELGAYSEQAVRLQAEIDAALQANEQLQTDVESAKAETQIEAARAAELRTALNTATDYVPQRAEAMLSLLSGVSLGSMKYDLGEVTHRIVRPGVWDDETQYFYGSAEVGFVNNLGRARFGWTDVTTMRVVIPLPEVQATDAVRLVDYQTDTEREQFARIGGRWGEQTEMFVLDKAREAAHAQSCQDVAALRAEMSKLQRMTTELSRGYKLDVRWMDSNGAIRSVVSDVQLLANAC